MESVKMYVEVDKYTTMGADNDGSNEHVQMNINFDENGKIVKAGEGVCFVSHDARSWGFRTDLVVKSKTSVYFTPIQFVQVEA